MKSKARKARRSFHMVQNMIYEQPISGQARQIYSVLCYFADNDTRECFPGKKKIAELCGIGVTKVYYALKELETIGLVTMEPRYDADDSHQKSNLYTVYDYPGEAFEKPQEFNINTQQTYVPPHSRDEPPPFTERTPPIHEMNPPHSQGECELNSIELNLLNKSGAKPYGGDAAAPTLETKVTYGKEFETVKLHKWEFDGLINLFGEDVTKDYINRLDTHIASIGKDKYANHYATILKWINKDKRENKSATKAIPKVNRFVNYEQRDVGQYKKYVELQRLIQIGDTEKITALKKELGLETH